MRLNKKRSSTVSGTDQPLPQARQNRLVRKQIAGEMLVYDLDRDRAHCLNAPAALVWSRCDGSTTVADMTKLLASELKTPLTDEVVWFALDQLRTSNLLSESRASSPQVRGMSRRVLMQRLGIAAVVSIPLVTSIVAPTAAAAATCLPVSAPCVANSDCCSNNCADNGRGTFNCS
jgi:hypothetical protein